MKYFVTTTDGYIKAENQQDAIEILNTTDNANEAIAVDEDNLPEDMKAEDMLYCYERIIIASKD